MRPLSLGSWASFETTVPRLTPISRAAARAPWPRFWHDNLKRARGCAAHCGMHGRHATPLWGSTLNLKFIKYLKATLPAGPKAHDGPVTQLIRRCQAGFSPPCQALLALAGTAGESAAVATPLGV